MPACGGRSWGDAMFAFSSIFFEEKHAISAVERMRWPTGICCPFCGEAKRVGRLGGNGSAQGSFKCYECRKRFSVRTGSPLEGSHIPLTNWLRLLFVMAFARRTFACKHVEEAASVSPRIARSLRRKWAEVISAADQQDIELVAGFPDHFPLLYERDDARSFHDLCRVLDVAPGANANDFAMLLQKILRASDAPRAYSSPVGTDALLPDHLSLQALPLGVYEGRKISFDRA